MTSFEMLRSFEDFLVHPTYVLPLDRKLPRRSFYPPPSVSSTSHRYSCPHIVNFSMDSARLNLGEGLYSSTKSTESLATMKAFNMESALARGYTSEEEAASPRDNSENSSLHSFSDSTSEFSVVEHSVPTVARAVQLSNRAQVVQLVSAGKVKVVSMPKVNESPRSLTLSRPSITSDSPSSFAPAELIRHKRERSGSSTQSISPRESTSVRPSRPLSYMGPPLLELDTNARQRRGSLPAIMTFARSSISPSPLTPAPTSRRPDFLNYDPFPSIETARSPASTSRRLMPMLMNKITKRRDPSPLQDVPELRPLTPTTSSLKPKMIARGADEVEPTIRLPPCPVSYCAIDADDLTSWPLRKDSVTFAPAARPHKRPRSVMIQV